MESGAVRGRPGDGGPSKRTNSPPIVAGPSANAIPRSDQSRKPPVPASAAAVSRQQLRQQADPARSRGVSRGRSRPKRNTSRGVSIKPPVRTWAAVASGAARGYELEHTPMQYDVNPVIHMDESDLEAADPKLFECLVGCFLGKKLPFKVVNESLKRAWGPALLEVMSNGRGLFLLRIADPEFRRKILEGGNVTVARIPLMLQQWKPGCELNKESLQSVPVWVRLSNFPCSFWSAHSISKVANALGKPLYVDQRTEQLAMLTFARVCVEITVEQPIHEFLQLELNGKVVVVDVEYEWRPLACRKCGIFGHDCTVAVKESAPTRSAVNVDAEPTKIPSRVEAPLLEKGKGVATQYTSGKEDTSVAPLSPHSCIRPQHLGEPSSPRKNMGILHESSMPNPANLSIAESDSVSGDLDWKLVKRRNKRKKKKEAKQAAAAAAAISFGLSPPTDEGQVLKRRDVQVEEHHTESSQPVCEEDPIPLDLSESSEDISNSNIRGVQSDDEVQSVISTVKRKPPIRIPTSQEQTSSPIPDPPPATVSKASAMGKRTSKKR